MTGSSINWDGIQMRVFYLLAISTILSSCQLAAPQQVNNTNSIVKETPSQSQTSELFLAVKSGDPERVRQALQTENPNSQDKSGYTPLMIAVLKGNIEMEEMLLKAGANPNSADEVGETALMKAIDSGKPELLTLLIESGADIKAKRRYDGQTVLHLAVNKEETACLKALLARNPDVNIRDDAGNSPLSVAAIRNSEGMQLLLDHGADVNATNRAGVTPLMTAITSQRNLKILLEHGANVNAVDSDGWTALEGALLRGCSETVDLLKKAGAIE